MLQKPNKNSKGFTLIELMIAVVVVGILAAIAIPNFLAYRGKSHCSGAETDVDKVMGAIADYFAIPGNLSVSENSPGMPVSGTDLSNGNTYTIGGNVGAITVTITDVSGSCPFFDTISKTMF